VYAVGITKKALKRAKDASIPTLGSGSVAGISAILLNEGAWKGLDFRAAVAEAVSRLVPGASCDIRSLLKEAEAMEKRLKKIRSEPATGSAADRQEMYG
jgi:uncharacterized protein